MSELLVPIKDKDSAVLAINLQADAIYVSGPAFSARQAASLNLEDLNDIIIYAHLYHTKVYVTLNTLIFDNEFDDVIKYVDDLISLNIDALIIQDLGLLYYLKNVYPTLELHGSTQMHLHNFNCLAFALANNIKRVVIPRELSLDKIKHYHHIFPLLSLEVFIHGALCTSYSGQCYYSAFYQTGSGNRGSCEQNCRRHHYFNNKDDYQLSLKDLAIKNDILLLNNSVDSFKIEGRLKSKEYLYSVIKYYQSILNNHEDKVMFDNVQIAFNRQYTKGKLLSASSNELSNKKRINNNGLYLGKIISFNNKYLDIKTSKKIYLKDNIRIVNDNYESGWLVKEVNQIDNNVIRINKDNHVNKNDDVYLVKSNRLSDEIKVCSKKYYRKLNYDISIFLELNKPIIVLVNNNSFISDFVIEKPINNIMNHDDIVKIFSKTNDTPIRFNIDVQGTREFFVSKGLINSFKRNIIDNLVNSNLFKNKLIKNNNISFNKEPVSFYGYKFCIRTYEQAKILIKYHVEEVYVDNLKLLNEINKDFKVIIPVLPRVIKDEYFGEIIDIITPYSKVMVSELGMLHKLKNKQLEVNLSMNITNIYGLQLLKEYNVTNVMVSFEDKLFNNKIVNQTTTSLAYTYLPLMIMEYCPINNNKKDKCNDCHLCQEKQYYLTSDNNKKLPLVYRGYDCLELFSDKPLFNDQKTNYKMISFTIENKDECEKILASFLNNI
ncbi:MAG: U32 family peptidase [Bacilli bacterium]|jgi:putative protease|nr:U32 family peptidase [Bacilli bacterium]